MTQRIDGVILLDKPPAMSSQSAVTAVKRHFKAEKAGHTGTLDPLATGLLPVCLGEATKYSQDLLNADKTYQATLHFGIETDTADADGQIISQKSMSEPIDDTKARHLLETILPKFVGQINQTPPMYSALKRDGKPLYEYARSGVELEREPRQITIYSIQLLSVRWPYASIEVHCSKGTYIRVLAQDIGEALGCGAHLHALRRTAVGHLTLDHAITLEYLQTGTVEPLPVDALLQTLPELTVRSASQTIRDGPAGSMCRLALGGVTSAPFYCTAPSQSKLIISFFSKASHDQTRSS
jgi:tRNA pseudouridine55 synthase